MPKVTQLSEESEFERRQSRSRFWAAHQHLSLCRSPTPATLLAAPLDNFVFIAHRRGHSPLTAPSFQALSMARTAFDLWPGLPFFDLEQRKPPPPRLVQSLEWGFP